jgi:dienelactone hydrolase
MALVIPQPTGSFGIGKSIHTIIDTSRNEKHGAGKRELLIYIYYPTNTQSRSSYASDIMPLLKENLQQSLNVDTQQLQYLDLLQEHTTMHAPLLDIGSKFPVLFFCPGLGDPVETYTTLLEEMASQGYVVIAINHTYGVDPTVFPNGKIVRMNTDLARFWYAPQSSFEDILDEEHEWWLQDANFVIDAFKNICPDDSYRFLMGQLDYDSMGFFGHSFGGSLALQICRDRNDIRACVDLDGIVFGPKSKRSEMVNVPCMFIMADKEVSDQELEKHNIARAKYDQLVVPRHPKLLYNALEKDSYFVTVKNSDHNSFSDLNLLKDPIVRHNNPTEVITTTRMLLTQFFNHYLRNETFNSDFIKVFKNVVLEMK